MTRSHQWGHRVPARWLLITVLLVAALGLAACGGDEEPAADTAPAADAAPAAPAGGPLKFFYFYAADCGAPCTDMDPVIASIETDFKDQAVVTRYDAASEEGKQLMEQYSLKKTPSYAILAADDTKLWSNSGPIHKDMLRQQMTNLVRQQ
jgi:hypothetical protein